MDSYYEISGTDGEVIQRIAVLTRTEMAKLKTNGYAVHKVTLSTHLWDWLVQ